MLTPEEARVRLQRKTKKAKRKAKEAGLDEPSPTDTELTLTDQISKLTRIKMSGKLRSFDCHIGQSDDAQVCLNTWFDLEMIPNDPS